MASNPRRRQLLLNVLPSLLALEAARKLGLPQAHAAGDQGIALLVGNTQYKPSSQDILTAKKNVSDLEQVLVGMGFKVDTMFNAGKEDVARGLDKMIDAPQAAAGKPVFFYYCGHGINSQSKGQYRNFLVSSGVELVPTAALLASQDGRRRHYENVASQSISLEDDIFPRFARRNGNTLGVLVIDACRDAGSDINDSDNRIVQSRPPDGCVAAFATRPGRYAYTPRDAAKNSFFTEALLNQLRAVEDDAEMVQLLQRVRLEVRERVNKIARDEGTLERLLARLGLKEGFLQEPETASSVSGRAVLRPSIAPPRGSVAAAPVTPTPGGKPPAPSSARDDAARWAEIETMDDADEIERAINDFVKTFANSTLKANALLRKEDLAKVRDAQRKSRLTRSKLNLPESGPIVQDYRAARQGDKFAAQRVAEALERNPALGGDPAAATRWLQYAAELGNGIAAYDAYRRFNQRNLLLEASYYLNLAEANGYRVPRDFDTRK